MESQSEDDEFNINTCSNEESIINRMLNDKKYIRVRIKTMTVIGNLQITNAYISKYLLSRLQIRDSSVVSSLIDLSGNVSGSRRKGGRNKSTVDKIKSLLAHCGSPSQQIFKIKVILKDPIYSEQSDQVDDINTEQDSPTIIDILNKIDKRNKAIVNGDVNTRRRVKSRPRLISKSSSECTVDQETFSFSVDGKTRLSDSSARLAKCRASNKIVESVLNIGTHKKQALALQCTLPHHRLFKQAYTCGYF